MAQAQAVLSPIPDHARFLELDARAGADIAAGLRAVSAELPDNVTVGLGAGLVAGLGAKVAGLHGFRARTGPGCAVPATQSDIFLRVSGSDPGDVAQQARRILRDLEPAFQVSRVTNGFKYATGLDLSGYEDGTENPEGDAAEAAAVVASGPLAGSSFVAVQKWQHDLNAFERLKQQARDHIIGRRQSDNVELDDAPLFAHTKRTAQESFSPEAFVVRRSMPWSDGAGEGLLFIAFGRSFDAFEAQLIRMTGGEDGIIDGLFQFSRAISGANYWCPPRDKGRLDLSALGM